MVSVIMVNFGSDDDLESSSAKPLPEPMVTFIRPPCVMKQYSLQDTEAAEDEALKESMIKRPKSDGEEEMEVDEDDEVKALVIPDLPEPQFEDIDYPDEAFHMVTQVHWEDDIIWNGDEMRQKILNQQKVKGAMAGWIPSSSTRTQAQFHQQCE